MQTQLKIASNIILKFVVQSFKDRSCVNHILSSVLFSQETHHITTSKISKLNVFGKTTKGAPYINFDSEMACYLTLK